MSESIKAIQAQQLYKVQPVSYNDGSNSSRAAKTFVFGSGESNIFSAGLYNLEYPSVEGSPTLGRSLDLRA